jgi:hypothetical protein
VIIELVAEDAMIELRGDDLTMFGHQPWTTNVSPPWTLTFKKGDWLKISRIRQSGSRSTTDHTVTIEGLGIDVETGGGNRGINLWVHLDEVGTFTVDCKNHPGEHGEAQIVVE